MTQSLSQSKKVFQVVQKRYICRYILGEWSCHDNREGQIQKRHAVHIYKKDINADGGKGAHTYTKKGEETRGR